MKNQFLFGILFTLSGVFTITAQSDSHFIIASQGGFNKGESISLSWTLGDIVTGTQFLPDGIVTQGFQQPFISVKEVPSTEISEGNPVEETDVERSIKVSVYPNPFHSHVIVQVDDPRSGYKVGVFNMEGRQLYTKNVIDSHIQLPLEGLPTGNYLIQINHPETNTSRVFQVNKSR